MLEAERSEFDHMLAELFGALGLNLTADKTEGFWKGLANLSLVEFGRCRDQILRELQTSAAPKTLSVAAIWQAKKALRAPGPVYQHQVADPYRGAFDGWAMAGNHHLLRHIRSALAVRPRRYGDPGNRIVSQQESREFARNVGLLTDAKNAWASDMRDLAANNAGEVSIERQKAIWDDYLQRAEAQIAQGQQRAAA